MIFHLCRLRARYTAGVVATCYRDSFYPQGVFGFRRALPADIGPGQFSRPDCARGNLRSQLLGLAVQRRQRIHTPLRYGAADSYKKR